LGFTAWLAAGGEEALSLYARHRRDISLALLGVCMPGLGGPAPPLALPGLEPPPRRCFLTPRPGRHRPHAPPAPRPARASRTRAPSGCVADALRGLVGEPAAP